MRPQAEPPSLSNKATCACAETAARASAPAPSAAKGGLGGWFKKALKGKAGEPAPINIQPRSEAGEPGARGSSLDWLCMCSAVSVNQPRVVVSYRTDAGVGVYALRRFALPGLPLSRLSSSRALLALVWLPRHLPQRREQRARPSQRTTLGGGSIPATKTTRVTP